MITFMRRHGSSATVRITTPAHSTRIAPAVEGIADVLDGRGIATYLASTRDEIEREAGAFDRMFYRNVDAIIHMPTLQEGEYRTDRLAGLLKNNPGHPPILSILGGAEIPGTFRLRMKDAEAGREAALRQSAFPDAFQSSRICFPRTCEYPHWTSAGGTAPAPRRLGLSAPKWFCGCCG